MAPKTPKLNAARSVVEVGKRVISGNNERQDYQDYQESQESQDLLVELMLDYGVGIVSMP